MDQPTLLEGEWATGSNSGWIDGIDPADNRMTVAHVPRLTQDQVREAIDVGEREAADWRAPDPGFSTKMKILAIGYRL